MGLIQSTKAPKHQRVVLHRVPPGREAGARGNRRSLFNCRGTSLITGVLFLMSEVPLVNISSSSRTVRLGPIPSRVCGTGNRQPLLTKTQPCGPASQPARVPAAHTPPNRLPLCPPPAFDKTLPRPLLLSLFSAIAAITPRPGSAVWPIRLPRT